jgi:hypothetical protein
MWVSPDAAPPIGRNKAVLVVRERVVGSSGAPETLHELPDDIVAICDRSHDPRIDLADAPNAPAVGYSPVTLTRP